METAYVIILVLLQIFTYIVVCSTTAFLFNHIVITKFLEGFFDCLMCKSRTFFLYITLCKFSYSVFATACIAEILSLIRLRRSSKSLYAARIIPKRYFTSGVLSFVLSFKRRGSISPGSIAR